MRQIKKVLFIVNGGISPKDDLEAIIEDGAEERGYTAASYPVDGAGDIGLYYKITKNE